jgi:hypothetical protein
MRIHDDQDADCDESTNAHPDGTGCPRPVRGRRWERSPNTATVARADTAGAGCARPVRLVPHHPGSELVRALRSQLPHPRRATGGASAGDRAGRAAPAASRDRSRAASSVHVLAVAKRGSHPDLDPRIGLVRIPSPAPTSVTPRPKPATTRADAAAAQTFPGNLLTLGGGARNRQHRGPPRRGALQRRAPSPGAWARGAGSGGAGLVRRPGRRWPRMSRAPTALSPSWLPRRRRRIVANASIKPRAG